MYNQVDPTDSRWVYNNREMGAMWRFDQKTGVETDIQPRRPAGAPPLRFNWTPPIALSPHNPAILYVGAQVVFRSFDRGDHWQEMSPDLTTNDDSKQHGEGYISYCTLTTLAESPVKPGVLWAGADDGKVQVTKDGGATWLDRTAALAAAGAPANYLGDPRLSFAARCRDVLSWPRPDGGSTSSNPCSTRRRITARHGRRSSGISPRTSR